MIINILKLEAILDKKIKRNIQSIGLDIAERTGICIISTDETNVHLDWNFIEFDKSNIDTVYKEMYKEFSKIIIKEKYHDNIVVIEDTFLQRFGKFVQPDVFKKLTRFGTLALAVCFDKDIDYRFILAISARSKLKIKMVPKQAKESVAKYLKDELDIVVDDNDISDAIVLAILGIIEGIDFRSQEIIDKVKKKAKKQAEKLAIKEAKKAEREAKKLKGKKT